MNTVSAGRKKKKITPVPILELAYLISEEHCCTALFGQQRVSTAVQLQCSVQQRFAAERSHTFQWINERQSMLIFKVGRFWLANRYVVWMTVINGRRRKAIHWHKKAITNGWKCDGSCAVASFPFWAVRVYSFMHLILVTQNVRTWKKILCRSGSQTLNVRHNF